MNLTDPLMLHCDDHPSAPWWLTQGNETFFANTHDPNWKHLRWPSASDARQWAHENLPGTTVLVMGPGKVVASDAVSDYAQQRRGTQKSLDELLPRP
jgi:hypothetical protein